MAFRGVVISERARTILLTFGWTLVILSPFLAQSSARAAARLLGLAILLLTPKAQAPLPSRTKRRITGICALVLLMVFVVSLPSIVVKMARPTPIRVVPLVDAQVVPGGDRIAVQHNGGGPKAALRSCFYADGFAVCAAHSVDLGQSGGRWLLAPGCINQEMVDGSPRMEANTSAGMVLSGVKCPRDDRRPIPIANVTEIRVGQSAIALVPPGDPMELEVLGFLEMRGVQYLLARGPKNALAQGDSGTPVIQDGKIIGFFTMILRNDRSLKFLRIASEVYSETMDAVGGAREGSPGAAIMRGCLFSRKP